LYHYTTYLLGKTANDSTSLPVSDFCRSANVYYRKAAYIIWRNTVGWEFDDSNYANLPTATTTIVDEQQDYGLPTNALSLERVEVLDIDGNYVKLTRMDKEEVISEAMSEYYKTPGMPRRYDVYANSVLLYPKPSTDYVTATKGLKLYLSRDVSVPSTPVAYRNISTQPGFQITFHPYLAYGAALDYGIAKNYTQTKIELLKTALQEYEIQLSDYSSKRDRDYPVKIRPKSRSSV
jgi:hypothetical protein